MKKIVLLAILVTAYGNLFAFTTQGNWRWRKDDGSETSASWIAAENGSITISTTDSTLRLRIELYNDPNNHSGGSGGLLDGALFEYSTDPNFSTYDTITVTEGGRAFVLASSSPYVTNGDSTTKQIVGQNLPFDPGLMILTYDSLPPHTLAKGVKTEYEWAIKPTANIQAGTTYYFRVDAAIYPNGTPLPSLVTAGTLAVQLISFNATADGGKVSLEWSTLTEQNNERFDIERSNDGQSWVTLTSVKGSGTSSRSQTYQVYDNSPLAGMNYYRIKQYNVDGSFTVSPVRSLKMTGNNLPALKVYPNPSHGEIGFVLQNYSGRLTATLSTIGGRMVHQETFESAAGIHKLNLRTSPSPGLYVLQVKGEHFSQSVKVVVQ